MEKVGERESWMDELEDELAAGEIEAADLIVRGMQRENAVEDEEGLVAEFEAIEEEPELAEEAEVEKFDEEEYELYDEDGYGEDFRSEEVWVAGEERAEELERERVYEVVAVPREILTEYDLPKLPTGVAIVGGTARSVARQILTGVGEPVRSLDLALVPELSGRGGGDFQGDAGEEDDAAGEGLPSAEELEELAKKYMPEGYIYGRGVRQEGLEEYFSGRDFTVDQCLVYGEKLMLTRAAKDDLLENVIRPTYGVQPGTETPTSEEAFLKAILMQATVGVAGGGSLADAGAGSAEDAAGSATGARPRLEEFRLDEVEQEIEAREYDGDDLRLGAFGVALTLNKAMSRGAEVAQELVDIFVENGIIDEYYTGQPLLLARKARDECAEFEYRPLAECPDEDPEYEGRGTQEETKRRTSGATEARPEEIEVGEYSADDYDYVNRAGAYSAG